MNVGRILIVAFIAIFASSYLFADEIHLKDGRIIKAETVWKENNKYYYEKYGATVSLSEEKVLKIVQSENSATQVVAANSNKNEIKKSGDRDSLPITICIEKCKDKKIICTSENIKDKDDCFVDQKVCEIDCDIDLRQSIGLLPEVLSSREQNERKEKIIKNHIKVAEKQLTKLKNITDEQWKRRCEKRREQYKNNRSAPDFCNSWEELKEGSISPWKKRIENSKRRLANIGNLDLNKVDLAKFTQKAKAERKNRIAKLKLSAAKNYVKCEYDKENSEPNSKTGKGWRSCQYYHDQLRRLNGAVMNDRKLQNTEIAFMEGLGIDLEKEAEKSIAKN